MEATVNIFQADDGNKYLVTWANTQGQSDDTKLTFFMSRLDGTTIAAGTAINMIQNAWSYLSDAQAAQALVDTGQSFMGGTIIDINKAFQPIGTLSMAGLDLNGSVYGFDIGNITGQALDSIGRKLCSKSCSLLTLIQMVQQCSTVLLVLTLELLKVLL